MELAYRIVGCCLVSYLVGALPFGLWIGLWWKGVDIRTLGSKNIGATNVLRVLGPAAGGTVFLLDTAKGLVGVRLAMLLGLPMEPYMPFLVLIGICAVLGHSFSPFLGFKGGKGIATSLGVLLALSPPVGGIGLGVWVLFTAVTRYVSIGSLAAAVSLAFAAYYTMTGRPRDWMIGMCVVMCVLATLKHIPNIKRLLAGTEPKFGQRAAGESPVPAEPAELPPTPEVL